MATETIRDLLVKLGVDAEGADAQVEALDKALDGLIDVATAAIAAAAGLTAAIGGLALSAAGAGDAVAKAALRTSTTVEQYQELAFAAQQSAVAQEQLNVGLVRQTAALTELERQQGPAVEGYRLLGLSAEALGQLDTAGAFTATAEALAGVTDEQERLQIASKIYGAELGSKLLPLLSGGADNLQAMASTARQLGLIMSEEQTTAATLFGDTLDQVLGMLEGIKNTIGLALLPTLTDLLVRVRDWAAANRELIASKLDQWTTMLVDGLEALGDMFLAVDDLVQTTLGGWGPVLAAVGAAVATVSALVAGLAALKAWAAIQSAIAAVGAVGAVVFAKVVIAILAVTAVIVGLVLAVQDLIVYMRGGDSALGRFLATFRESTGLIGGMTRALEQVLSTLASLGALIMDVGAIWWAVFSRTLLPALRLFGAAWLWMIERQLGALGWWFDSVVLPVFAGLQRLFDWLIGALARLQPGLDFLVGALDSVLGQISDLTGVDVTVGGAGASGGGVAGAVLGNADTSLLFAPSTTEALGTTGALAAAGQAPGGGASLTVQGNNYTINGAGLSREETEQLIANSEAERARQTRAALQGTEV